MRSLDARVLGTASFAAIMIAGMSGTAYAQPGNTAPPNCNELATEAEREACREQEDEPAVATDVATLPPEQQPATRQGESIVVTGSRIRRPSEFNTPDPVTIITPELSYREGDTESAEILQQSPVAAGSVQITSVISSNFVANGGFGVQTVDLRGLGAERTLTLLNGRRAGPAGVRGAVNSFDLNVLPSSIISSIQILKTGASSIYGSDAIAGVVNILTKRDTDGIDLRAFVSLPEESGGETYNVSATWGEDFGRGHILASVDYFRREELQRIDREFLRCSEEYIFFQNTGERADLRDPRTGEPTCFGGVSGVVFLSDFSSFFTGAPPNLVGPNGRPYIIAAYDFPGSGLGAVVPAINPPNSPFQLSAPPQYRAANFDGPSTGIFQEPIGDQQTSVYPRTERITGYLSAAYEVSPSIELYLEGIYNNRKTYINATGYHFPDQFTGDTILPFFFCADPDDPTQPGPAGGDLPCDPFSSGDPLNSEFSGEVILSPQFSHNFQDFWQNVDYYRGVVGGRGDFGSALNGWTWDAHLQYSRSDGDYSNQFTFLDAFERQEYRTQSCVGTVTRIRGVPCMDIDYTSERILRGDYNAEEQAFLFGEETGNTLYTQITGEFATTGTLVRLPAGNLAVAAGVQWRRDEINDVPGEHTLAGNVHGLTGAGITAGSSRTMEAFAEIEVPLIHNTPFFHELTLTGAARVTNVRAERASDGFADESNGNWTYRLAANWRLNEWFRLRGSYGTSYRAPALFEQFLANETGFFSQGAGVDPCTNLANRLAQGTVSQTMYDNCVAHGVPTDFTGAGLSGGITISQGGVGVLEPETSDALTFGFVLTPPPLWSGMRFSLAVDYFDIEVRGQIARLGAANIVASCYASQFFPNDPLCALFTRINNPAAPNDNAITEVLNPFLNINQQRNKAIDFTARFVQDMGNWGTMTFQGQVSWQLHDEFTLFEGTTTSSNGEAGDPKLVGDFNLIWDNSPITIVYGLDYIGATSDVADMIQFQGPRCRTSVFRPGGTFCVDAELDPVFYHSLSATVELFDRFEITAGVNNLTDRAPPRASTVFSGVSAIGQAPVFATQYDYFGRRFFVNARARF